MANLNEIKGMCVARIANKKVGNYSVDELAESSINLSVKCFVKTEDYWTLRAQILEGLKGALDEAGVLIPFPQLDLHIVSNEKS